MEKKILLLLISLLCLGKLTAQNIYYRQEHSYVPYRSGDSWGYKIAWNDSVMIKAQFEEADLFSSNGLARVKQNDLYGFIDKSGNIVIPCQWEYANTFYNGQTNQPKDYVYVGKDEYLNQQGEVLHIAPSGDEETAYMSTLFQVPVRVGETEYFDFFVMVLDTASGQFIKKEINLSPDSVKAEYFDPFKREVIVKKDNQYGVIDVLGNVVLPIVYDAIYQTQLDEYPYSGLTGYILKRDNLMGYVDFQNRIYIPIKYKSIKRIDLNIAEVVTRSGKEGFIDVTDGTEYFDE